VLLVVSGSTLVVMLDFVAIQPPLSVQPDLGCRAGIEADTLTPWEDMLYIMTNDLEDAFRKSITYLHACH